MGWEPHAPLSWGWWIRQLPSFAVLTVIPWAARFDEPLILYLLWTAIGGGFSWLLGQRWRLASWALPALFGAAMTIAAGIREMDRSSSSSAHQGVRWVIFILTLGAFLTSAGWTFKLAGRYRRQESSWDETAEDMPAGLPYVLMARALLGAAIAVLAGLFVQSSLVTQAFTPPERTRWWFIGLSIGSLAGGLVAVTALGLWRTHSVVSHVVKRAFDPPRRPVRPTWREGAIANAKRDGHTTFIEGISIAVAGLAQGVARVIQLAGYGSLRFGVTVANQVQEFVVVASRLMSATLGYVVRTVVEAFPLGVRVVARFSRGLAVPAVSIVLSTYLAWASADRVTEYLHDAGLGVIPVGVCSAVLAGVLLVVAWAAITGAPPSASARSIVRFIEHRGGPLVLLVVLGGWAGAISGWAGYGQMQLGPITVFGSAVILAASGWQLWSPARRGNSGR